MAKTSRLMPVLTAGAVFATVAYAYSRRARRSAPRARATRGAPSLSKPHSEPLPREAKSAVPDPLALDLEEVFGAEELRDELTPSDALVPPTVQAMEHLPRPGNGDDAEPPAPEDLGRAWLSQATEAEYSTREQDLTPDLENIAMPEDELDIEVEETEPASEREFQHSHFGR